jgi:hypothetical protein
MKIPAINRGRSGSKADHLFLAGLAAALLISAAYILLDSGTPLPHPISKFDVLGRDLVESNRGTLQASGSYES